MIKVMIVGLPGNMATYAARRILLEKNLHLLPYSITGNDVDDNKQVINDLEIALIRDGDSEKKNAVVKSNAPFIAIDFTEPNVVHRNIEYYCRNDINFVMGTTGVVINKIKQSIKESNVCAVIAPNMAKQIVALQAMLEFAAKTFPGAFIGYNLAITESHQENKLDTSGTARAMIENFHKLGMKFDENEIVKIRDPDEQKRIGVPEHAIDGHGWHTYKLDSEDRSVHIELVHNVNGREIYADGTVDSIYFLNRKIESGESGKIFSMIDVLRSI